MTSKELLEIEANMFKWNGKHFIDHEKKIRFMFYRGFLFKWNPDIELWEICNYQTEE